MDKCMDIQYLHFVQQKYEISKGKGQVLKYGKTNRDILGDGAVARALIGAGGGGIFIYP